MKAWLGYVGVALLLVVAGVALALVTGPGPVVRGVLFSGVLAWCIQAVAFAALLRVRGRSDLFMFAWLGGIALRFVVVAVVGIRVTRTGALPASSTLVSLVAFVFVMLMFEPLFLRKGQPTG